MLAVLGLRAICKRSVERFGSHSGIRDRETKSCQIAMALRSRFRPSLMISRYGSQVLAEPMAFEFSGALPLNPTPKSVITAMAGFELAVPFPLVGRFSGLGLG